MQLPAVLHAIVEYEDKVENLDNPTPATELALSFVFSVYNFKIGLVNEFSDLIGDLLIHNSLCSGAIYINWIELIN